MKGFYIIIFNSSETYVKAIFIFYSNPTQILAFIFWKRTFVPSDITFGSWLDGSHKHGVFLSEFWSLVFPAHMVVLFSWVKWGNNWIKY
jgi:hypothetical protein